MSEDITLNDWPTVKDADNYAKRVASGKIIASKYIKLACERYLSDKKRRDWRWKFDPDAAQSILDFMSILSYPDGDVAGEPMRPHTWHTLFLVNMYGFVDKEDPRINRFIHNYAMVGRSNSKSTLASAIAMYELFLAPDKSELYLVARNREQARIIFNKAAAVARKLPEPYSSGIHNKYGKLVNEDTLTKLVPQSRDSKSQDGLSARLAIFDECASIVDSNSIEVITSSQGKQVSPRNVYISTAQPLSLGETLFRQDVEWCKKILDGTIEGETEDRVFALLYSLDEEDEWDQPDMWIKANPSIPEMGTLITEHIANDVSKAKAEPSRKNNLMIKYFNLFINSTNTWLDVSRWDDNIIEELDRSGPCYIGVDLGKTSDLSAVSLIWVTESGEYHAEFHAFLPQKAFDKAPTHVRAVYDNAYASGILHLNDGDTINHRYIKQFLVDLLDKYDVKEVPFDPYKSQQLITELEEEGVPVFRFRQGRLDMAPAVEASGMHILLGQVKHTGNPFISWQISNTMAKTDEHDLTTLEKSSDRHLKIDNVVAMVQAIGRATVNGGLNTVKPAVYIY